MRLTRGITQFGRTVSALDGEAKLTFSKSAKNVRLEGFKIAPRYGFANVASKPGSPSDTYQCLGLGFVQNTDGLTEGIIIEDRGGTIRPYSINYSTFARTQIGSQTLAGNKWIVTGFGDNAYLINPTGTKTLYRHEIGNNASLVAIEDTAYTPPSQSATLTVSSNPLQSYGFINSDVWNIISVNGVTSPSFSAPASGVVTLSGNNNDNGTSHRTTISVTFHTVQDWSQYDYIAVRIEGQNVFPTFERTNVPVIVKTAGVDRFPDYQEQFNSGNTEVTILIRTKGLPSLTNVEELEFTIGGYVQRGANGAACKIHPIDLGGTYIEASASTDRLWDSILDGDGVIYGARYMTGATPGPLVNRSITRDQSLGFRPEAYTSPLGGRINLSVPVSTTVGVTDVQFLRLMQDGTTWKILSTVPNTGSPQHQDRREEHELTGLVTATGTGVVPVDPPPPFSTAGIVYAFAYKNSMVWLIGKGTRNIQISRVGNAEEIYDDNLAGTYDPEDLTNPARLTMADNSSDIPVWGSQIGQVAIILGNKSAYSFSGDFPPQVTPCREIPGSRGVAGPYAACRVRPTQGQYAVDYMDSDFNVWRVGGTPRFVDDASVRPVELSEVIRGKVKQWLYDDQRPEFPTLTASDTILQFDDVTSSLWVILGKRAVVFRQGTGNDGWDFYEYQLTVPPGSETVSTCTPWAAVGASASSVDTGDAAWTNIGFPFASDDAYAVATFGYGTAQTTKHLRSIAFNVPSAIPASATITSFKYRVESSKTGDLSVTHTKAQPRKSGVDYGANLATNRVLTSSDVTQEFTLASPFTVSEINSGVADIDLQFTQETWLTDWNNPANWSVTVGPDVEFGAGGESTPFTGSGNVTVTINYTGPGAPPSKVFINFTGTASMSVDGGTIIGNYPVTVTANNGGGVSESVTGMTADNPSVNATGTVKVQVPLTAGSGTYVRTMTVSATATPEAAPISGILSGTATIVAPTPATVRVDNVQIQACYTVTTAFPGSNFGIYWGRAHFYDGLNFAARSSGQLDVVERHIGQYITGINRDGGYPMPTAFFETQDMSFEGGYAQVAQVQTHTETIDEPVAVAFKSDDKNYTDGTSITVKPRWKRFELDMVGIRFNGKLTFGEDVGYISGLTIEYNRKSRGVV